MAHVHLSLGSNIGDRMANLRNAIKALPPHVAVEKVSNVYESEAISGFPEDSDEPTYLQGHPLFYNIALKGTTLLTPLDLFRQLKAIEQKLGRTEALQDAPRELDVDILFYDDLILDTPELTIPHPRLHERPFVLVPLEEIDRFFMHPVRRMPVIELWADLGKRNDMVWEIEDRI